MSVLNILPKPYRWAVRKQVRRLTRPLHAAIVAIAASRKGNAAVFADVSDAIGTSSERASAGGSGDKPEGMGARMNDHSLMVNRVWP